MLDPRVRWPGKSTGDCRVPFAQVANAGSSSAQRAGAPSPSYDQTTADGELGRERLWNGQRRSSDQHAIERCLRTPAQCPIAVAEADVFDLQFRAALACALLQRFDAFNRKDAGHQRREHRGLIAAAGANFEHLMQRAALEQRLAHARDDVGLRDGLSKPDRQSGVFIGTAGQSFIDENMSRQVADAIQHGKIRNALIAQSLYQPVAGARRSHADAGKARIAHRGSLNRAPPFIAHRASARAQVMPHGA